MIEAVGKASELLAKQVANGVAMDVREAAYQRGTIPSAVGRGGFRTQEHSHVALRGSVRLSLPDLVLSFGVESRCYLLSA